MVVPLSSVCLRKYVTFIRIDSNETKEKDLLPEIVGDEPGTSYGRSGEKVVRSQRRKSQAN